MKCIVVYVVVSVLMAQVRGLTYEERHQIALQCIREVGIDPRVIDDAIAGKIPKNDIKYNEFLACSYKKQGFMNQNGEIMIDNVKKFLANLYTSSDLTVLDGCSGHDGLNHADNAVNGLRCIIGHLHNMTESQSKK